MAIGDCATYGGLPAVHQPSDSRGLQFDRGGARRIPRSDFVSKAGLPVINIPGCPRTPTGSRQIIVALAAGRAADLALDEFQRPKTFFGTQTRCTRVQFYTYKRDRRAPAGHTPTTCSTVRLPRTMTLIRATASC